mmetsp:Transcript_29040/g.25683  ORF Transcript_29040/g.25683 Transcript_29040/m.25683 type:complete len:114 (+) Transcript_29040:245-586(+)
MKSEEVFKDKRRDNKFLVAVMGKIVEENERKFFEGLKEIWTPKGFKDAASNFKLPKREIRMREIRRQQEANEKVEINQESDIYNKIGEINKELIQLKIKSNLQEIKVGEDKKY